ncbi:MAG: succinylglutamate desuccinylase/aspartoacylase family protein [Phycisphaeraceae bacterium]
MNQWADDIGRWGEVYVSPGQRASVHVTVSQGYVGADVKLPVYIWRASKPGPTVSVTAAVHGDEINGTGTIRQMIIDDPFKLRAGTLVLVPVINVFGFERHSRYMPDRRDLNRCFPGSRLGSLSSRFARAVFDQIIRRCDYGIDLHTAAVRRTNFPNVRADLSDPRLREFARAFGSELVIASQGPVGSLRRCACKAGIPTLILEAGEVWKVEPAVVEYALRGIRNCLIHLGMVTGKPHRPAYRVESGKTRWVRAVTGGLLTFHVRPGDVVRKGEPLATNTSLVGIEQNMIESPMDGIILGMTTLPSVAPGDPICHIVHVAPDTLEEVERARRAMPNHSLHNRLREDLATSMFISESDEEE